MEGEGSGLPGMGNVPHVVASVLSLLKVEYAVNVKIVMPTLRDEKKSLSTESSTEQTTRYIVRCLVIPLSKGGPNAEKREMKLPYHKYQVFEVHQVEVKGEKYLAVFVEMIANYMCYFLILSD